MIDPKEFRIGNLVIHSDSWAEFVVMETSPTGLAVENDTDATWIDCDQLDPIPLTEEWLLRMGFELEADGGIYHTYGLRPRFHGDTFEITQDAEGCWYYNHDATNVAKLKFVHELQNLVFALTGKELEIKTK